MKIQHSEVLIHACPKHVFQPPLSSLPVLHLQQLFPLLFELVRPLSILAGFQHLLALSTSQSLEPFGV